MAGGPIRESYFFFLRLDLPAFLSEIATAWARGRPERINSLMLLETTAPERPFFKGIYFFFFIFLVLIFFPSFSKPRFFTFILAIYLPRLARLMGRLALLTVPRVATLPAVLLLALLRRSFGV